MTATTYFLLKENIIITQKIVKTYNNIQNRLYLPFDAKFLLGYIYNYISITIYKGDR